MRIKLTEEERIERRKLYVTNYLNQNKEKIREQKRLNYEKNRLERIAGVRKREKENREQINKYRRDKCLTDPLFKIKINIRNLIGNSVRNQGYIKTSKTYNILGCDFDTFIHHIRSQFESWMTLDNHGKYNGQFNYGWDIDHIIPLSSAKCEEDVIRLNHYSNLRPLCSKVNRDIKRGKH